MLLRPIETASIKELIEAFDLLNRFGTNLRYNYSDSDSDSNSSGTTTTTTSD